jgi:hypothetical protein
VEFAEAIDQLGRPRTFAEAIDVLKDRGTRWFVERFGISERTARRWRAGTHEPARTAAGRQRREEVIRAVGPAARHTLAIRALRAATSLYVGRVEVRSKSDGSLQGERSIGTVVLDHIGRRELDVVIRALEEGEVQGAGNAFSDLVLGLYAKSKNDNRDAMRAHLYISQYPSGIRT